MLTKISNKIKRFFSKENEGLELHLPDNETATFYLMVDNIKIAILSCKKATWTFSYTNEFKSKADEYTLITGFPDINKSYESDHLWPFFNVRIPGLKQPFIQEIIKKEHIDQTNEVALLRRFGKKTIANPYELILM